MDSKKNYYYDFKKSMSIQKLSNNNSNNKLCI